MVFRVQEYQTRPDQSRLRTYGSSTIGNARMETQQFGRKHDTNMDPAITMTPAGAVDFRAQSVGHGLC